MTTIEPTRRDKDAAAAFFRDERTALSVKFSLGHDPAPLLETLARHAAAERAMERAAIVEWLRRLAGPASVLEGQPPRGEVWILHRVASIIEAGQHLSDNAEAIARGE